MELKWAYISAKLITKQKIFIARSEFGLINCLLGLCGRVIKTSR